MEGVKAYFRLITIAIVILVYGFMWTLVKDEIKAWILSTTAKLPVWVLLWLAVHVGVVVLIFVWAWI